MCAEISKISADAVLGAANTPTLPSGGPEISNIRGLAAVTTASLQFAALANRGELQERLIVVPQLLAPLSGLSISVGKASYALQSLLGSGASGFVFKAVDIKSGESVAIKFSGAFSLPKQSSIWEGRFGKDSFGENFRSEVHALDLIGKSGLQETQQLVRAGVIRGQNDKAVGVLVSKFIPGENFTLLEQEVANGKLPIVILGAGSSALISSAISLARLGISVEDLALSNCRAQVSHDGKLESFAVLDFGTAQFYDMPELTEAWAENLDAVQGSLIRQANFGSPIDRHIARLFDYARDGISDLLSGDITPEELLTNLCDPQFIGEL